MKYIFLSLLILLALTPASYAEGSGNANRMSTNQQEIKSVSGTVIGEDGTPLPGVTVAVKGTSNGTITDMGGNYNLRELPANATLIFSFVGMEMQEIVVASSTINVTMKETSIGLEEVVAIGYGTQRKVDLTGSVAVVDADELKKVSNSNISTMLQGKVSGVQITTDGQPGADPSVRIRGVGSFGSTSPLYVVDGVPMGTTIRDFSPNDIETLQVLKDASAAAIYGSRAANGVVIITTKQGKKNQALRVDYKGYLGVDRVQDGIYDVMDAYEYADYVTMAYNNSGMDVPAGYDPNSPRYVDPNVVNTNWFNEAFKTGVRQNHNINLSGGGENNTYNVALDYYSQNGTMVGAGPNFERYTARINNTMDVKFLKIRTNVVYSHSDQDNMALSNANEYVAGLYGAQYPVMASALITPPSIKAYDPSTWVLDDKLSAASEYTYDSFGFGTYYDDVHGDLRLTNVLLTNSLLKRNSKVDRIVATGSVNVDLFEMFGAHNDNHKLAYNLNVSQSRTFVKSLTFVPAFIQSTTNYLSKSSEILTIGNVNYANGLIENTMTYNGSFGRNKVDVVVGQTFERNYRHDLTGTGYDLSEPYYLHLNNAAERSSSSYEEESLMASYIGRVNYNFDDKYLLSATFRRDASSRLSPDDRVGFFPSVSAGWRMERESFFPFAETTINLFKLRGSYGELGSIANLGPYGYMGSMARGDYTYSFNNNKVTGSAVSYYVNEQLKWEKKKMLDLGIDMGLFNNRLEVTMGYYKATSEDLHYDVQVPANAGVTNTTVKMNAATMTNSGFEFLVAYHNREHAVKFDITANASTLKNRVTKLGVGGEPRTDGYSRTEVGREVGGFYGYVYEGIFRTQDELDNRVNSEGMHINQNGAQLGDVAYADINNDGDITNEDQKYLGSGMAKLNYGFNVRAEYKGFDLSVATFGAAGFNAVDFVDVVLRGSYGALNKSTELLNAWTPENPTSMVPRVAYKTSGSITNDFFSQRFIQKADYLKIANIELGYNFPDRFFGGYVRNVRLYASAQNVATFSKYKGYNVDFAGGTFTPGYNYASYPTPRTFMFGVNLSF